MVLVAGHVLQDHEGPAVSTLNADAAARWVILCEHATLRLPDALGDLGLDAAARSSHIAWDPGALGVAEGLAQRLDAPLVRANFSRLAYDCNRPPEAASAIAAQSEIYAIPGNAGLDGPARAARAEAFYYPFHRAADAMLDRRGATAALVTIHSFTPIYHGQMRAVELGILHDTDSRLADAMLRLAPGFTALKCERNQPYGPGDGVAHSLQRHGIARGIPNVMIEIRNDLIATPDQQAEQAEMLAALLAAALAEVAP